MNYQKQTKTNNANEIEISIVIPAYREEQVIEKTLEAVKNVLEKISERFEIICVVDGRVDGTFSKAREFSDKFGERIRVYGYQKNRGKGFALRLGFRLAKGRVIGFIDADGQIKPEGINAAYLEFRNSGADIVIGSKKHKKSDVSYSPIRRLISAVSQLLIKVLFGIGVKDTQAGLKLFGSEFIASIIPRLTIDRFATDIEILALAKYLGYTDIVEIPIVVMEQNSSDQVVDEKISFKDLYGTFRDTLKILYRLRVTKYYDAENSRFWIPFVEPELLKK